jgi:hypothetical protein
MSYNWLISNIVYDFAIVSHDLDEELMDKVERIFEFAIAFCWEGK